MKIEPPRLSCVHEPPPREPFTAGDALLCFLVPLALLLFALTECP